MRLSVRLAVSIALLAAFALFVAPRAASALDLAQQVVDLPSRPGTSQRVLVLSPPDAKAAVVLLAGGHGGLQLQPDGSMRWGRGNFLVRTRERFARRGLVVAIVDAPSDRQSHPFLHGFRTRTEHVEDLKAVIAWLRERFGLPVWLVGTSRGTQSAAWAAVALSGGGGPDGLVLTSSILADARGLPVTAMPLERLQIPVLVVHHERDGCSHCAPGELPQLNRRLAGAPRTQLLTFDGGASEGDPCEARSHHGFLGIEADVVDRIAGWMLAR